MTTETGSPRSRRAILAAGAAAGVATVASALGRPSPASASTHGVFSSAVSVTPAVSALNNAPSDWPAAGVYGESNSTGGAGVWGYATAATGNTVGVIGESYSTGGRGVYGYAGAASGATYGVVAQSNSTSGTGVYAQASAATGATYGVWGNAVSPDGTGVYGIAWGSNARGVTGETTTGRGVNGLATTGTGVRGDSTSGMGVRGQSTTGTAGYFSVQYPMTGISLRATGRVKLDKSAGVATITSGTNSITVTPGIDVLSTSAVVATLMGDAGGSTTVKRVVTDVTANTFTIILTANAAANVKVAWHVFG